MRIPGRAFGKTARRTVCHLVAPRARLTSRKDSGTVPSASREAIGTVPAYFREASLALGATKWQTIHRVVLPNALPGIMTGTILALSRAAGETAPILFTVAAFYLPRLPKSMLDQCMALPYHLYVIATQVPNVKAKFQYGTALVLILMVMSLNITAALLRANLRRKKLW